MRSLPFVSIIIASFNGRHYLNACLSSINNLNYPKEKLEIILVDDGSEDKTYEFIKKNFSHVNIVRNYKNRGAAESRNIGIKNAKGQFLAFLDNDVEVERGWLSELVKAIEYDKQIGICASKILFKDKPDILNSTGGVMNIYADAWDRSIFEKDISQYENVERVFFGCSAAILIRKAVLEKVGYFDARYFYLYEDVDLGWRMNLAGYKIMYVPSAVAYHKFCGGLKRDTLKVKYLIERNRIRMLLKNYEYRTLIKNSLRLSRSKVKVFIKEFKNNNGLRSLLLIYTFKAWLWNFIYLLDTLKERRCIQRIRKITDEEIIRLLGDFKDKIFEYESSHNP